MSIFQLLNGLTFAALLFVVAAGFTLIFGLLRIVNLSHGALYLFGGYIGFTVAVKTGSFIVGGAAAMAAVALARPRPRSGAAALRTRQRATSGAADPRRRLRAQRPRAGHLGRRHVHRADARGAAGRHERVRRVLSRRSACSCCWSASSSSSACGCSCTNPARRPDPRRRRRCRDGRGDRHQHPLGLSRHLHARARRWRGWQACWAAHSSRSTPAPTRNPRLQPRRRHHWRTRQP